LRQAAKGTQNQANSMGANGLESTQITDGPRDGQAGGYVNDNRSDPNLDPDPFL
jgi:hypothetical protein